MAIIFEPGTLEHCGCHNKQGMSKGGGLHGDGTSVWMLNGIFHLHRFECFIIYILLIRLFGKFINKSRNGFGNTLFVYFP